MRFPKTKSYYKAALVRILQISPGGAWYRVVWFLLVKNTPVDLPLDFRNTDPLTFYP